MQTEAASSGSASDVQAALIASIGAAIDRAGGWIPFSAFMDSALYAPGLGYYSAGAAKIGRSPRDGSDFVTAPVLTPLFGRTLARPVAEALARFGGDVLELGGGTGALAIDLLVELEALGRLPRRYRLLEVSADLRERQRGTIAERAPRFADRVEWITALPDAIDGVVVANEVLDALPVDLIVWDGHAWLARGVVRRDGGFAFGDRPLPAELADAVAARAIDASRLPPGYQTELHGAAEALVASIAARMTDAAIAYFIDYGFPRDEYYHPQRAGGTLATHRGHRVGFDPFSDVGLTDLTSHVDFSAIADAAADAGAPPIGYASQAAFLIDCGVADALRGVATDTRLWAAQASALQTLLSEAEMGELFKVIAFARRDAPITGFRRSNRLHTL